MRRRTTEKMYSAWHDTTHDLASFDDFQPLTGLVAAL